MRGVNISKIHVTIALNAAVYPCRRSRPGETNYLRFLPLEELLFFWEDQSGFFIFKDYVLFNPLEQSGLFIFTISQQVLVFSRSRNLTIRFAISLHAFVVMEAENLEFSSQTNQILKFHTNKTLYRLRFRRNFRVKTSRLSREISRSRRSATKIKHVLLLKNTEGPAVITKLSVKEMAKLHDLCSQKKFHLKF